jgi:hypothetical protein
MIIQLLHCCIVKMWINGMVRALMSQKKLRRLAIEAAVLPKKKNREQERVDATRKLVKKVICEILSGAISGMTFPQLADTVLEKVGYGKPTARKYLNEMVGTEDILEISGKPTMYKLSEKGKNACNALLEEKSRNGQ